MLINKAARNRENKKDSLSTTRWAFSLCFSYFCPTLSLIFLYFFNSVLHSFPHFRWFTTVLAVNTGVEVSGLVKVGDDSWGVVGSDRLNQSQEEERKGIRPIYSAFFSRVMEHGMDGRCL